MYTHTHTPHTHTHTRWRTCGSSSISAARCVCPCVRVQARLTELSGCMTYGSCTADSHSTWVQSYPLCSTRTAHSEQYILGLPASVRRCLWLRACACLCCTNRQVHVLLCVQEWRYKIHQPFHGTEHAYVRASCHVQCLCLSPCVCVCVCAYGVLPVGSDPAPAAAQAAPRCIVPTTKAGRSVGPC